MKESTYNEYMRELNGFIRKHEKKADLQVWTSPLVNGSYHKEYCFSDGATFCEVNEMEYKEWQTITIHGIKKTIMVNLIRHEYWSTDDSESRVWYE